MLTIQIKNPRVNNGEIAEFLRSRIDGSIEVHGKEIRIQDAKSRDVKLLIHKFLHQKGMNLSRVEVVQPGLIEVLGPEPVKPHWTPEKAGAPPSAAVTLPYYFPGSPRLPGSAARKTKEKKR